ncbi:hypothetical protein LCGC14_1284230 [marine sediment metagenome]|uniref:Uncharacterized protein n=1 Tax=marine sediment metagenome TaxID=412755 RepID=A0A0F9KUB1_9ZZZZ
MAMGGSNSGTTAYLTNDSHYSGGCNKRNRRRVSPLGELIKGLAASLLFGAALGLGVVGLVKLLDWMF